MQVECLHPTFIINPSLSELIARYRFYVLDGRMHQSVYTYRNQYNFDKKLFREYKNKLTNENYKNNFVVDVSTGDTYPIYLLCPCNHCILCTEKKKNSLATRMLYESYCYNSQPLFVTLTYRNERYPKTGVSKRDVQLFLKRFRISLVRAGYTQRIRYLLCSEYGSKTGRGHYHAIFYGLPINSDIHLRRIQAVLYSSWSNGFTYSRAVDMSNPNTVKYTIKYLNKECHVPEGFEQPFILSSRGHGGIGSKFIRQQIPMLHKRVNHQHKILDKWTGQLKDFVWSKYALDKIYPTVCTSIPSDLRKALRNHAYLYSQIAHFEPHLLWLYQTKKQKYDECFSKYIYFGNGVLPLYNMCFRVQDSLGSIEENERIIDKYLNDAFFKKISQAEEIAKKRNLLVSKLLRGKADPDLIVKCSRIRAIRARSAALEVL